MAKTKYTNHASIVCRKLRGTPGSRCIGFLLLLRVHTLPHKQASWTGLPSPRFTAVHFLLVLKSCYELGTSLDGVCTSRLCSPMILTNSIAMEYLETRSV